MRWRVPRELVGFAAFSGFTFLIDLGLLAMLHAWTRLPLAISVSISYCVAFALNFLLNRRLNFRSHGPARTQARRWVVVACGDFSLTLGVTTGLNAVGLDYRLARLAAGACVVSFSYLAARRWVFRASPGDHDGQPVAHQSARA
ncbi:MAG TPA: GtrA family protein [Jatrophihabitantaceae bacterium]|nr:GtrA family protein [Jatrophihabitantaceae bacterium]